MKVEVYWNLHAKCWSIRHAHGKLIDNKPHRIYVEVEDVAWVVQQGGRERVLKERKKNVHAFARGTLVEGGHDNRAGCGAVTSIMYNPYMHQTFIDKASEQGTPVRASKLAIMSLTTHGSPQVWALGASQ
tara:strand:+ start:705 stop:1094 length:390 start_codon:yes stop_codon:yes gene_type:complete